MAPRTYVRVGGALLLFAVIPWVGSCGFATAPITGPDPGDNPTPDLPDQIPGGSTLPGVTCLPAATSVGLAQSSGTPKGILPEPILLVAPGAVFTVTGSNSTGEFGKLTGITITATSATAVITVTIRGGTSTDGELESGQFFTDVFTSTGSAPANPTVSVFSSNRRCSSQIGDALEILDLDLDPMAGLIPGVKRFQATFYMDCIQGCVNFIEVESDTTATAQ